jgi:hypothetical protein
MQYKLPDIAEYGLCEFWQLYILQRWIFRKCPRCTDDYQKFVQNVLIIPRELRPKLIELQQKLEPTEMLEQDATEDNLNKKARVINIRLKGVYAKLLIDNFIKGIIDYRKELIEKLKPSIKRLNELENELRKNLNLSNVIFSNAKRFKIINVETEKWDPNKINRGIGKTIYINYNKVNEKIDEGKKELEEIYAKFVNEKMF